MDLSALIVVGSRNLAHFDAALVGYTFAVLFATFGITYRYAMWLQRPPTAMYCKRGWQFFLQPGHIPKDIAEWITRALAIWLGSWRPVFYIFAAIVLIWGIIFFVFGRDAKTAIRPKSFRENFSVLRRSPLAWVLALFYFLTFGGFVAFSICLPTLLKDEFKLEPADAGARTAGFVLLATLMRPLGG